MSISGHGEVAGIGGVMIESGVVSNGSIELDKMHTRPV